MTQHHHQLKWIHQITNLNLFLLWFTYFVVSILLVNYLANKIKIWDKLCSTWMCGLLNQQCLRPKQFLTCIHHMAMLPLCPSMWVLYKNGLLLILRIYGQVTSNASLIAMWWRATTLVVRSNSPTKLTLEKIVPITYQICYCFDQTAGY